MHTSLLQLLQRPDVWRPGDRRSEPSAAGNPTGHAALDRVLHGGGWPRAALTELLLERPGCGELRLLLPLLAALGRERRWQLWIDPPFIPYAPALLAGGIALEQLVVVRPPDRRQWLWTCAQALRAPGVGAVLCWPGAQTLRYAELRQLQVAASSAQCCGFLLRDTRAAAQASPSALRLRLRAVNTSELAVDILRQRGGRAGQRVVLAGPTCFQQQPALSEWPYVSGPAPAAAPRHPARPQPAPDLREVTWQ